MTLATPFPLGRHVEHDPASRGFQAVRAQQLVSVKHEHAGGILEQGDLGSCTGNALAAALNTRPLWDGTRRLLTEDDARELYSYATHHDGIWGHWPPEDTGSSGLAVCKAGRHYGYLTAYRHAFGLQHALEALVLQPLIIGVNWHSAMFNPDASGFIVPRGDVDGGHEIAVTEINVEQEYVSGPNSWGEGWGVGGFWKLRFDDFGVLLEDRGDVTVPQLAA